MNPAPDRSDDRGDPDVARQIFRLRCAGTRDRFMTFVGFGGQGKAQTGAEPFRSLSRGPKRMAAQSSS